MHRRRTAAPLTIAMLAILGSACSVFDHHEHGGGTQAANKIDLNSASRRELAALHALNDADIDKIIKNRPYAKKHELLDRGILDQKKFNAIRDDVQIVPSRGSGH